MPDMTEAEWLKPWEYRCVLCGCEWRSFSGLYGHIEQVPHLLTLWQYGTLKRAGQALGRTPSGGDDERTDI